MKERLKLLVGLGGILAVVLIYILVFNLAPKTTLYSPEEENATTAAISCTTQLECGNLTCSAVLATCYNSTAIQPVYCEGMFCNNSICVNYSNDPISCTSEKICNRTGTGAACMLNTSFFCTDSDEGINYYLKGNISSSENLSDYCFGTNQLREYFCNFTANSIQNKDYNCSIEGKICSNGACIASSCIQNWSCSSWSSCISNNQTRVCTDTNNCNNITGMPFLSQSCGMNCSQNWTAKNTSCSSSETYTIYYIDSNNCNSSLNMPSNYTARCDYDRNGIIGNSSSINGENTNVQVYINSQPLNISKVYNTTRTVELRDSNTTVVSFDYTFTSPLDLTNITLIKQPSSSSVGYVIIEGLSINKTLFVDKLQNTSNRVCVKNRETTDIDELTDSCGGTLEYLINCPGSNSSFSCSLSSGKYRITGLTSSAAKEMASQSISVCTPNWQCTVWAACTNSQQGRICTDMNNCSTLVGRPNVTQSCTTPPACTPNWQCTVWNPSKCPESETQTRTCEDNNACGVQTGKPSLSQSCDYTKPSSSGLAILILILAIAIAGITGAIIYLIYTKRQESQPFTPILRNT